MTSRLSQRPCVHGEHSRSIVWHAVAAAMIVVTAAAGKLSTPPPPPPPRHYLTTPPQLQSPEAKGGRTDSRKKEGTAEKAVVLWRGGVVPYVFCKSINATQKSIILQAMGDFHKKTCIRFTRRRREKDYIVIDSDGPSCQSSVGRTGGRQVMYLNAKQCIDVGTVIHELMHILGLFHEHAREDRSRYVTVHMQNVIPDNKLDFDIVPGRTLGVRYNYNSILHYGPYAFSKKPGVKKTIVPRDPKAVIKDPWQRTEMADTDAMYIHKLYKNECQ